MKLVDRLICQLKKGMPVTMSFTDINGERKTTEVIAFVLEYIKTVLVEGGSMVADSSIDEVIQQLQPFRGTIYDGIIEELQERKKVVM